MFEHIKRSSKFTAAITSHQIEANSLKCQPNNKKYGEIDAREAYIPHG
jgi:hypothetical protein